VSDVFVSYSRRDGEFVHGLAADLESRGKSVWIDTQGIGDGEVFPDAIRRAIEGADAFVFVISPESVASQYCESEVEYALELQKRVVPVLREPVTDDALPEEIRVRNWIPYTPDVDAQAASERLVAALNVDLEHSRSHTHWLVRALDWDAHARDRSFLLRGSELRAAEAWLAGVADHADPALTALQRDYVYISRAASSRRQRLVVTGSLVVGAIAIGLAVLALISRNQAQHSATVALAQSLGAQAISEPQLDQALLLATEGVRLSNSPVTRADLLGTLLRSPQIVASYYTPSDVRPGSLAVSPDGTRLAIGEYGNAVPIYSTKTRTLIGELHVPPIIALGYTPDGEDLVVSSVDQHGRAVLRVFDSRTDRSLRTVVLPTRFGDPTPCTRCLVFADHGRYALTETAIGNTPVPSLVRWDLHTGTVRAVHFAGSVGTLLATAGGHELVLSGPHSTATIWDPRTLGMVGRVRLPAGEVAQAVSPNGDTLALSTGTGGISFMNVRTGVVTPSKNGGPTELDAATFTPDGRTLVTAGGDGRVVLWNAVHDTLAQVDLGHSVATQELAVTADGSTLYTAALDGSVIAYDLTGRNGFGIPFVNSRLTYGGPWFSVRTDGSQVALPLQDGRVQLLAGPGLTSSTFFDGFPDHRPIADTIYSPNGRELEVGAGFGDRIDELYPLPGAALWNVAGRPRPIGKLTGFPDHSPSSIAAAAFTPDDNRLIAVQQSGTQYQFGMVGEFDAKTGHIIGSAHKLVGSPDSITVSPDGSTAAVGLGDGRIEVLALPSLRRLATPRVVAGQNSAIPALAFSPSGTTIAAGDYAGAVHLINAATFKPALAPLHLVAGSVISLSFSSDGNLLAESGTDTATHVIDVAAWRPVISPLLQAKPDWVSSMFANNDRLFTFAQSGNGSIWPLSTSAMTARACSVAHRNLSHDEWNEFLPGRAYKPVCQ
jgi:WD40 repeat protein